MSKLRKRNRARSSQGETRPFEGMRQVNPHAAGVDIGAKGIIHHMLRDLAADGAGVLVVSSDPDTDKTLVAALSAAKLEVVAGSFPGTRAG